MFPWRKEQREEDPISLANSLTPWRKGRVKESDFSTVGENKQIQLQNPKERVNGLL